MMKLLADSVMFAFAPLPCNAFPLTTVLPLFAATLMPVPNLETILFNTVGDAPPDTAMPLPEPLPTTVLLTIRPNGDGTGESPAPATSPENKMPVPELAITTLFVITVPGNKRCEFSLRSSATAPGRRSSGVLVKLASSSTLGAPGSNVARMPVFEKSRIKFDSMINWP